MISALAFAFVFVLKIAIYALVTAVFGLCGLFFGFVLIVHALDWWNNRRPAKTGPLVPGRKRL